MDLKKFVSLEVEEIKKHKWILSEKAGKDLTGIAEQDWIQRYAALFRAYVEREYGPIENKSPFK